MNKAIIVLVSLLGLALSACGGTDCMCENDKLINCSDLGTLVVSAPENAYYQVLTVKTDPIQLLAEGGPGLPNTHILPASAAPGTQYTVLYDRIPGHIKPKTVVVNLVADETLEIEGVYTRM